MKTIEEIKPLHHILEASEFMVSDEVKERFKQNLTRFTILKGRILVHVGQVSPCLYFIEKGVMRTYYHRGAEDITSLLISDGEIVCIAESFLTQTPSKEVLETLEDTTVYAISYESYRTLVEKDAYMATLAVKLLEQHLIRFTDRVKVFKYLSVEKRIEHYVNQPSSLFRRIPDHYIATYLGTTPATFSRALKTIQFDRRDPAAPI